MNRSNDGLKQQSRTRKFVAEHVIEGHLGDPDAHFGCMICVAWRWAQGEFVDDSVLKTIAAGEGT